MRQLAETGWQQMHQTLLEQGLSKKAIARDDASKKKNVLFFIAAGIFFFLIFSYPYLIKDSSRFLSKNRHHYSSLRNFELPESSVTQPLTMVPSGNHIDFQKDSLRKPTLQEQIIHTRINDRFSETRLKKFQDLPPNEKRYLLQKFLLDKVGEVGITPADKLIPGKIHIEQSASHNTKCPVSSVKRPELFVGAAINSPGGNDFSHSFNLNEFNLHPSFSAVFSLSRKFSLHTGLEAFSVIHGKTVSAKEKELVNNVAFPGVYYDISTISIIKASYFDIPLTVDYSINRNWSVGGGFQLSKLYKVNMKEEKESFNYNNTLYATSITRYNASPMGARAAFQKKVEIKKLEPCLIAETNFKSGRLLFSAGYYYGLGKSIQLKDNYNNSEQFRNQYFRFSIRFRIKSQKNKNQRIIATPGLKKSPDN